MPLDAKRKIVLIDWHCYFTRNKNRGSYYTVSGDQLIKSGFKPGQSCPMRFRMLRSLIYDRLRKLVIVVLKILKKKFGSGGGGKIDFKQGSHLNQMLKYAYEIV